MSNRLTMDALRDTLRDAEPAAMLIEPRILRRVIRLDRRLAALGLLVPHRKCYTIDRGRLLAFVDRGELDLPDSEDLPRRVILLAKPADDDALDQMEPAAALAYYERLLFHARVHLELERRIAEQSQPEELAARRREQIGEAEFAEIRAVLLKDGYLFPQPGELETYVEFAAVYLELHYFDPAELPVWFPGVRDWERIEQIVSQDIYHAQLHERGRLTRPAAMAEPGDVNGLVLGKASGTAPTEPTNLVAPSMARRWAKQARRAANLGNSVKAAVSHIKGAAAAEDPAKYRAAAEVELDRLADRLSEALKLRDAEAASWRAALRELLEPASRGFWSVEARLLYDLQKVCVERERGIYKLDLIQWCTSLGKVPLRRPLPLLREALIVKHLRSANRRLASATVSPAARLSLETLLATMLEHAEESLRQRLRPLILEVFDEVGLVPQNVPEHVARRKLIEELLDRVVEKGFFSMGDLRDALSRNDLKLPDVSGPLEILAGDRLLKADDRLGRALDGVYRRGTVYLRWPQRLSSLFFGTHYGRMVTQYGIVPFGGAYLALEGLRHIVGWFIPGESVESLPGTKAHHFVPIEQLDTGPGWPFYAAVLVTGVWLLILIHVPQFRRQFTSLLTTAWRVLRELLYELPRRLVQSPWLQHLLHSAAYRTVRSYLARPALVTLLLQAPMLVTGRHWSLSVSLNVFLAAALFLNSPIGCYADEWLTDVLGRTWYDLRMRIFAAAYQWIMDTFHQLIVALERVVYTVDEFLRFRSGDSAASRGVKLVTGACWFLISYVILFVFTLLVEPQINPIKHFPVVTVAHKLILPLGVPLVKYLSPYLGSTTANTLVWSTIWLIPGVFGFLVWELKENWRLYAANRRQKLAAVPIGDHGERMAGLLRPGFHSGTLPKQFALLRKAVRRSRRSGDTQRINRRKENLHHVEMAVRHFVEREWIGLCEEARILPHQDLRVGRVRVATNCVSVEVLTELDSIEALELVWCEQNGILTVHAPSEGWLNETGGAQRTALLAALSGLMQRSGADLVRGDAEITLDPPYSWQDWVDRWSSPPSVAALKGPHVTPVSPTSRAG